MPDVFKILKDLELKCIGLDPQTNKMQEGCFISFRDVGLPIHKGDFANPWSPPDGDLEATLNKPIPTPEPSDPANAPKIGSGQTDENKVAVAGIPKSQQSYLNTFLLTDDKLKMNNQYSLMPGSGKVSDAWWAIITGATPAAQGTDPAIALIGRAKKRFINSLNQFQSIGQIPYTFMLPNSWYDPDHDDGWTEYTSADFHHESHYTASSTAYRGGGGFSVGFWAAGTSFNHADQQRSLNIQIQDLEVSFKYCPVDIKRPWLDTSLLNLKNWFLMGDYKKGCISSGTMGQELPQNAIELTFLPSIVISLVLIKDLSIKWSNWKPDWDSHAAITSASDSVGWGPFAVHGSYSHHGEQRDFEADTSGESLKVPGIQLIGYVSTINPLSPAIDSSHS